MPQQAAPGVLIRRAAGLSDVGRRRERNEDAFALAEDAGVLVVADGMGGHQGGEVASGFVAALAPALLRQRLEAQPGASLSRVRAMIRDVILDASCRLRLEAVDHGELHGMGTTIVLVCVRGDQAIVGSMGDSRAYLFRERRLRRVTHDHSLVALLLRRGEISGEEALTHPARGKVSRYVGMESDAFPDVRTVRLAAGDRLLLCTDGLTGMVDEETIGATLAHREDPETICRELIEAANARGGHDNVTVIVADCCQPERTGRSRKGGSTCRPQSS